MISRRVHELLRFEALSHIHVRGMDEPPQSRIIDPLAGPELDMAHEFAGALKQATGVGEFRATKKADIDVSLEAVGVSECCVPNACGGMAVTGTLIPRPLEASRRAAYYFRALSCSLMLRYRDEA